MIFLEKISATVPVENIKELLKDPERKKQLKSAITQVLKEHAHLPEHHEIKHDLLKATLRVLAENGNKVFGSFQYQSRRGYLLRMMQLLFLSMSLTTGYLFYEKNKKNIVTVTPKEEAFSKTPVVQPESKKEGLEKTEKTEKKDEKKKTKKKIKEKHEESVKINPAPEKTPELFVKPRTQEERPVIRGNR